MWYQMKKATDSKCRKEGYLFFHAVLGCVVQPSTTGWLRDWHPLAQKAIRAIQEGGCISSSYTQ